MNSWQQPITGEPGGASWHKVANPTVGWFSSKTSGWTADSFSSGLTVDFSAVVPAGTRAVRAACSFGGGTVGSFYSRKGSDTAISDTPVASTEYSCLIGSLVTTAYATQVQCVIWLSSSYTADFAVSNTDLDLYVSYPLEYLL